MRKNLWAKAVLALVVLLFGSIAWAEQNYCDIADVGRLAPNDYVVKLSLINIWQGAVGGLDTKNADRITGLYDYDFYYLLAAEDSENYDGDYALVHFSAYSSFGNGLDEKVGSFFTLNENAKGDEPLIIDKLFVELATSDRLLKFNIGKIDLEDYFDLSLVAGCEKSQFLAYSLFHNPAIPFASKGLGVRALYEPSDFLYAQAAVVDARADKRETGFNTTFHGEDYFLTMAEVGIRTKIFDRAGAYRFIGWYDPQVKPYLDGSGDSKRDDMGFAVTVNQGITEKTTAFFRYGWADERVNEIEDFVSFGGQVEGPIEGRDEDVFAVGYVKALRSPKGLSSEDKRKMQLVETYYRIRVKDNVELTPNLQFVMNPGGLKSESHATVFGVRLRVKF